MPLAADCRHNYFNGVLAGFGVGVGIGVAAPAQNRAWLLSCLFKEDAIKLATTINVRGVELKQDIAVKLTSDDKKATIKGKFDVDFSKLNMKGMEPEPGSTEHVLPTISFDLNLSLNKK